MQNYLKGLPPLFRKVPQEEINAPSPDSWSNIGRKWGMDNTESELVWWLIDFMVDITLKVDANEMTSRSIGKSSTVLGK